MKEQGTGARPPHLAVACLASALLFGCNVGPRAAADWRMADRTVDLFTDVQGGSDVPGPDGAVDDYDTAQGPLNPRVNGNVSTRFPEDGSYEVVLDACASEGAIRFSWSIDGAEAVEVVDCETTARLSEGTHEATLVAVDGSGGEDRVQMSLDVRDLIVVGLGDSFSAGSGSSRGGLVSLDYDNARCTRSGRSGQAKAALELERRDPKTSVTFIHLACGGARTDPGLLRAHNGQPPQLLELSEILPPGQAVDFLTLTIGGNDIRFSEVVGQLVGEPDAPLSLLGGERLHDRSQRLLLELREGLARVAACFGEGFQGRPCVVEGPSGRDDDFRLVTLPPIPVASPGALWFPTKRATRRSRSARAAPSRIPATSWTASRTVSGRGGHAPRTSAAPSGPGGMRPCSSLRTRLRTTPARQRTCTPGRPPARPTFPCPSSTPSTPS